jgi:hypothetical protein
MVFAAGALVHAAARDEVVVRRAPHDLPAPGPHDAGRPHGHPALAHHHAQGCQGCSASSTCARICGFALHVAARGLHWPAQSALHARTWGGGGAARGAPRVGDLQLEVPGVAALEGVEEGRGGPAHAHRALHGRPQDGPAPVPRGCLVQRPCTAPCTCWASHKWRSRYDAHNCGICLITCRTTWSSHESFNCQGHRVAHELSFLVQCIDSPCASALARLRDAALGAHFRQGLPQGHTAPAGAQATVTGP